MNVYRRLLGYSFKYKYRLITGVVLSFFVSILNGASLTSVIPIFNAIGKGGKADFQISLTKKESIALKDREEGKELEAIQKIEALVADIKIKTNFYLTTLPKDQLVLLFVYSSFPSTLQNFYS